MHVFLQVYLSAPRYLHPRMPLMAPLLSLSVASDPQGVPGLFSFLTHYCNYIFPICQLCQFQQIATNTTHFFPCALYKTYKKHTELTLSNS